MWSNFKFKRKAEADTNTKTYDMHIQFYIDKRHLIYNQLNKPECMLMTHLLSAVFKGVVMQ